MVEKIIVIGCEGGCFAFLEGSDALKVFGRTADEAIGVLAEELLGPDALPTALMDDRYWCATVSGDPTIRGMGPSRHQAMGDFLRNRGGKYFNYLVVTR